jgi:hypothetical protein
VRWSEFEGLEPELAEAGRRLFTQYGVGLAFLATIRPDGGPRLHPMCPMLVHGGLFAFIVPGPKHRDLLRDGRYAMHAFTPEDVDDEFAVVGTAARVEDLAVREQLVAGYHTPVEDSWVAFEFDVQRVLLSRYRSRGDWPPTYTVWNDDQR